MDSQSQGHSRRPWQSRNCANLLIKDASVIQVSYWISRLDNEFSEARQ